MAIRCDARVLVANIFSFVKARASCFPYVFLSLPTGVGIPSRMTDSFITNSADATIVSSLVVSELVPAKQTHRSAALALKTHWPEYLMECAELALFMISACVVTALLEHPASPLRHVLPNPFTRRLITGLAMGLTLLALIHSKWGKRSGAHMNPAFTLMFLRLGKVEAWDAAFYAVSQFAGGVAGVLISLLLLGPWLAHPNVNFAATQPGMSGILVAFTAELLISFVLALTVLVVSNHSKLSRFTPYFAASLVAAYITLEAPFSGMSMNPARTLGSAFPAHMFHALWIYFTAPPLAMLMAAELYVRAGSARSVYCAKFHHANNQRCIFRCRYMEMKQV
jgi:aquaporin Z